jgi:4-alpha-glucanotransferase
VNATPPAGPARSAGVLLHPTSLPGPFGIGDLGPTAHWWVDVLGRAAQSWWQVLPLGPTSYGDSPYQSFSSFAGNVNLLSPELLARDGLISPSDFATGSLPHDRVDYDPVIRIKSAMLTAAWERFRAGAAPALRQGFEHFRAAEAGWLDDYALFMALKSAHQNRSWQEWPRELVLREAAALNRARQELADTIGLHQFGQFLFFRQLEDLRRHAHERGIALIGDVPIFTAADSVDVWANPEFFLLDQDRRPFVVAGVPPDYFSKTGQLWGNPLYNWEALATSDYAWWVARLRAALRQVDLVRIDHFRGFEAYWEIPAGRLTAEVGRWVPGPGAAFFEAVRRQIGGLPFIAEDLGVITPEVVALREQFGLPGMQVLQFAFDSGPTNKYLPHRHPRNTVVYTGTHDNDTTRGWFATRGEDEARFACRYVPNIDHDSSWELIRLAWGSVADTAVVPLQDALGLGNEARMNTPGKPAGNWRWRFRGEMLTDAVIERLAELTHTYERSPKPA